MTITTTAVDVTYSPDGSTTAFALPFAFLDAEHVKVEVDGVLVSTGYSITGAGDEDGGTLTFDDAPTAGTGTLYAYRETPRIQEIAPVNNASIFASVLSRGLDQTALQVQEIDADVNSANGLLEQAIEENAISTANAASVAEALADILGLVSGSPEAASILNKLDKNIDSLADIKAKAGTVGDTLVSSLYGGSVWVLKTAASVKVQATVVSWDDELHQQSTSGVWECQLGSIVGYLRRTAEANQALCYGKVRTPAAYATALTVNCNGDSITHGQVDPGYPSAQILVGVATGYDDGSVHAWDRIEYPWPRRAELFAESVLGTGAKVTFNNRGYSGDRIENGYARGRFASTTDASIWSYMVNDANFATDNATSGNQVGITSATAGGTENAGGLYVLTKYVEGLAKAVARDIIRGIAPFIAVEGPYQAFPTGYDGTSLSRAKLLRNFNLAARRVAQGLGVPIIDFGSVVGLYGNSEVTTDSLHPNDLGHQVRAARVVATLVAAAYDAPSIAGECSIGTNPAQDPVFLFDGIELAATANSGSFQGPFFTASNAADVVIDVAGRSLGAVVDLAAPESQIMFVGTLAKSVATTKTADLILDFGVTPPSRPLDPREGSVAGTRETVASSKSITVVHSGAKTRKYNYPAQLANHVRMIGKGPHIVQLRMPASDGAVIVAQGFRFGDFGNWKPLTLLTGFTVFEETEIEPAWCIENGQIKLRGILLVGTPMSANQDVFAYPTEWAAWTLSATASDIPNYSDFQTYAWTGTHLRRKAATGGNLVNLAEIPGPRIVITRA